MFKKRLQALGRGKDWDDFFADFQKKHKGKRRLIQMVNLVGDRFAFGELSLILKLLGREVDDGSQEKYS